MPVGGVSWDAASGPELAQTPDFLEVAADAESAISASALIIIPAGP
jgi:hypothetical protein